MAHPPEEVQGSLLILSAWTLFHGHSYRQVVTLVVDYVGENDQ